MGINEKGKVLLDRDVFVYQIDTQLCWLVLCHFITSYSHLSAKASTKKMPL